jgi:PAS domain S-box-containing protein
MELPEFTAAVRALQSRALALDPTATPLPQSLAQLQAQTYEELRTALEELRVAEEELRQQNDELLAAQALADEQRQRYRDLFEHAPDGYLVTDPQGVVREANRAAGALLGAAPKALSGKPLVLFIAPNERSVFHAELARLARDGRPQEWLIALQPRPGRSAGPLQASVHVAPVRDRAGTVTALRWLVRDESARWADVEALRRGARDLEVKAQAQAAELERQGRELEQLRARSERHAGQRAALFEHNPQPLWVYEPGSLCLLAANPAALEFYGYARDEFLRRTAADLCHPDDRDAFLRAAAGSAADRPAGPWRHRDRAGAVVLVRTTALPFPFNGQPARLVAVTDVTDRLRHAEEARHARRLEPVGRIAGRVALEFARLHALIGGRVGPALEGLPDDARREHAEAIRRAVERGNALTEKLTALGGRPALAPQPLDLNAWLPAQRPELQSAVGPRVEVRLELCPGPAVVRVDPDGLREALFHLAQNAQEAMPGGGTLTLATAHADAAVRLAVRDTGRGMTPEVQARLFEPFFSTKLGGAGIGLGLAAVDGFVRQSGGRVRVTTAPALGTTVRLELPADPAAVPPRPAATVLVVDDDPAVRSLVALALRREGYAVVEADGGRAALEREASADLLVTDVQMPGVNGPALAAQLQTRRPGLKVLFVSGGTGGVPAGELTGPGRAYLEKPFAPAELVRRVRELLG